MEIDRHIVINAGPPSVSNLDGDQRNMYTVKLSVYQEAMSHTLPYWLAIGPISWHYTDIVTKADYKGYKCTVLM